MNNNLNSYNGQPEPELYGKVMQAIAGEKALHALKIKLLWAVFGLVLNLSLFYPVWQILSGELAASGASGYLSLAFSDLGSLAVYWQDFMWTMLESFPAISIAAFLLVAVGAGFLLSLISRQFKAMRSLGRLSHY